MTKSLYFLAILPPASIQDVLTLLKKDVSTRFQSKHALNSPPHITIHMPFKWKDKKIERLKEVMDQMNSVVIPFEIELKDFGFFEPRVVYVNIIENKKLEALQKEVIQLCRGQLNLDNANYRNKPFHPHVTIAFRDLRKDQFYKALDYFKDKKISLEFTANQVSLLKHDGKHWLVCDP